MRFWRSRRKAMPKGPKANQRKLSDSPNGAAHRQHRSQQRWSRLKKATRIATWLMVLGVGSVGVAIVAREAGPVVNSWFTVREVIVQGLQHVVRQEIVDRLALPREATLFSVWPDQLVARVGSHPWIKSAVVTRVPLHALRIEIVERKPAAIVKAPAGNILVDESGAVLARIGTNDDPTLPAITGVDSNDLARGEVRVREVIKAGVELAKLVAQILDGRAEVNAANGESLVASLKGVRFQVGTSAVEEQWERFRKIKSMLRPVSFNGTGKSTNEIDLRYADRVIIRERG